MFRDQQHLHLKAGDGGRGCLSFLREKFMAKGGPDGGDGGKGGDVVLVAVEGMNTLYPLSHQVHRRAEDGRPGAGSNCYGRNGRDLTVELPIGTMVRDRETGVLLKDMVTPGERVVICKGGKGGRGNKSFAGPTNQVPKQWEPGQKGETRWVELELKLIADVGIVGLPNAGKSTLLSAVSDARPKIADYPFTTLIPQPGIVSGPGYRTFVMADLPGLIEGAHAGVGLGHQFLRHVERTRLIVHLVDLAPVAGPKPGEAWRVIRRELEQYSKDLAGKPEVVVGNKADLPGWQEGAADLRRACGRDVLVISAATRLGLRELTMRVFDELERLGKNPVVEVRLPQAVKPGVSAADPRPAPLPQPAPPSRPGAVVKKRAAVQAKGSGKGASRKPAGRGTGGARRGGAKLRKRGRGGRSRPARP